MDALATAFGVVLVAELGDKSMLFGLAAATRYRWWMVLLPVAVAAALLAAIAVAIGEIAGHLLGETAVVVAAGILFIAFGLWAWRSTGDARAVPHREGTATAGTMLALGLVFFAAELGDKSQAATMVVAGIHQGSPVQVWLGATAGMVTTNAIGIAAGRQLGRYLQPRVVRLLVAAVFIAFGLATLATLV